MGKLPPLEKVAELPPPPPFNLRNLISMLGVGMIFVSLSLGAGEAVTNPIAIAKYGPSIMWLATVTILLQIVVNLHVINYTMTAGETIASAFMRIYPRAEIGAAVVVFMYLLQWAVPTWAVLAGGPLFAIIWGRMPTTPADENIVAILNAIVFIISVCILFVGPKIEKVLEYWGWAFTVISLALLIYVGVLIAPGHTWIEVAKGAISIGAIPSKPDWFLLGGFAAAAGAGGVCHVALSSWYRDKGYGTASLAGYIPALIKGKKVHLSAVGKTFEITDKNLSRWKEWWRYVRYDQFGLYLVGCMLGMLVPAIAVLAVIPVGTTLSGAGVAAALGNALVPYLGGAAGAFVQVIMLWILLDTQVTVLDGITRGLTDIIWTISERTRRWAKDDVRRVYYLILGVLIAWSLVFILGIRVAPAWLAVWLGQAAGINFTILAFHLIFISRTLPREVRPPKILFPLVFVAGVWSALFFLLWLLQLTGVIKV